MNIRSLGMLLVVVAVPTLVIAYNSVSPNPNPNNHDNSGHVDPATSNNPGDNSSINQSAPNSSAQPSPTIAPSSTDTGK